MKIKQNPDRKVRQALRRFFSTVDETLRAAEEAQHARQALEKAAGKTLSEKKARPGRKAVACD